MKRAEWTPASLLSPTRRLLTTPSPSDGLRSAPATRSMWAVRCMCVPFVPHARFSFRRPRLLDGVDVSPQSGLSARFHRRQCSTATNAARSAAELAFEAAIYGEPVPLPSVKDGSTAEPDTGKAREGSIGGDASGLKYTTEASVAATAARLSPAVTVVSAKSASLSHSTPADDRVEVPSRLQVSPAVLRTSGAEGQAAQQAMHSTEKAFEQALYSAYFDYSPEPKPDPVHTYGALSARVVAEGATGKSVALSKAAPGARSDNVDGVALAEAAFACALYGFEEPESVVTPADVASPLVALQSSTQVEENSVASSTPDAVVEDVTTAATTSGLKETAPFHGGGTLQVFPTDAAESMVLEGNHEEQVEAPSAEPGAERASEEVDSLFEADHRESKEFVVAAPKTAVRMVEAAVVTLGDDGLGGDAAAAPESTKAKPPACATPRAAPELEPAHPPPPPTVTMTCPFTLTKRDVADDAHALRDALFGVADFHTRVVTHLYPADRVEVCMPLFDRDSKWTLFYESGWLMRLQEQENAWISVAEPGKATAAPATVCEETGKADVEGCEGSPVPLEANVWNTLPFTHREVVGRSKVLRCLVYRLLRVPHLWWDEVLELAEAALREAQRHGLLNPTCSTAAAAAATHEDDKQQEADISRSLNLSPQELQAAMSRVFGTHPLSAHFFSAALERELVALLHDSTTAHSSSFRSAPLSLLTGPAAAWRAFVLTHRLSATAACGPHVKPFSYGEFRPTITAAELAPLQYCQERASWPSSPSVGGVEEHCSAVSLSSLTSAEPATSSSGVSGDSSTTATPWSAMNEREQNAFLFGDQSAQLTAKIRSSDGIFLVYGQDGMSFEEEERFTAAEEALRQEAQAENEEEEKAQVQRLSPLKKATSEEMARLRLYDVDHVVLELTAAEARHTNLATASASFLREVSVEESGSSSRYGRGVRSPVTPFRLHLQNREDVQLAALWSCFVHARTGDLLDNLMHVQRHGERLVREAAAEMVVQAAFWLLFHSREEVRAVTDPRRTYETVWGLHDHLMELLRMRSTTVDAHGDAATAAGVDVLVRRPPPSQRCAFESLALSSQVSYACFGVAHVPPTSATAVAVSEMTAQAVTGGPAELYETLANRYKHHDSAGRGAATSASALQEEQKEEFDIEAIQLPSSHNFNTLAPLQQLAVGFGFPRSTAEVMEAAVGRQEKTSVPLSTYESGIEKVKQMKEGLSLTPMALRSQSRRRGIQVAEWVAQAEVHRAAEYTAAAMATAAVQHILDASARRRGQSPAAAATSSDTKKVAAAVAGESDNDDKQAAMEPDKDDAADTSVEGVEGGFLSLRNKAAFVTPVSAEAPAQEAVRRKEAAQADMHEAVEASLRRCFAALRAAGELPRTSPPSTAATAIMGKSQDTPLFTAAQQATLQGAVDALVAIFYPTAEKPKKNAIAETHTGEVEGAPLPLCETRPPPPPRKRGRNPGKVAAIAATASKFSAHDEAAVVLLPTTKRRHLAAVRREIAEASPPSEKPRRGRPRRTPSADGTYVKAAYRRSATYQEKRRRKKEVGP